MKAAVQRLHALSWRRRLMLVEALALLTGASLAIRMLAFRRVMAIATHFSGAGKAGDAEQRSLVEDATWAIARASARVPWRAVCFDTGLALHLMLRRRSIDSLLHYGVRHSSEAGLAAHVWVSHAGQTLVGGEAAGDFTCLATFPSSG